jgi:hypothetical protein
MSNFIKKAILTVFLDIEKSSHTPWHFGLLYNLPKLKYSIGLITDLSTD